MHVIVMGLLKLPIISFALTMKGLYRRLYPISTKFVGLFLKLIKLLNCSVVVAGGFSMKIFVCGFIDNAYSAIGVWVE